MLPSPPLIRTAVRLLRVVPAGMVRRMARGLGTVAYFVAPARRATLIENVAHLVPGAGAGERRRLVRRTFANLLEASVDLFRLPSASRAELLALVRIEGLDHLDAALAQGRGVVIATSHVGPYELGGAYLAARGYPVHAMVEDIDEETNAALALYREATGMRLVSRRRGLRAVLRILRDGEIILLVADRIVGEGSEGIALPFGDGVRRVPTGPAAFALASGAALLVGYIVRDPTRTARYLIRLEAPVVPASSGDAGADRRHLTTVVAAHMAATIRQHPDQWFVFQPEWTRREA